MRQKMKGDFPKGSEKASAEADAMDAVRDSEISGMIAGGGRRSQNSEEMPSGSPEGEKNRSGWTPGNRKYSENLAVKSAWGDTSSFGPDKIFALYHESPKYIL